MNNYDHFKEAKIIADSLERQGLDELASIIRSSIDYGSTGSEILMQLQFHLKPIQLSPAIDLITKNQIKRIIFEIDKALNC